jgi:hypothetical protein
MRISVPLIQTSRDKDSVLIYVVFSQKCLCKLLYGARILYEIKIQYLTEDI